MAMKATKKIPAAKKNNISAKDTATKKKKVPEVKEPEKEEMCEKKGAEFHGFTFSSTPIEEAIFAHVVRRISAIPLPKLHYSQIRGAVHSWVSGTALDAVLLLLITNNIMERTDHKGRPALQFKNEELRRYPVQQPASGRKGAD
jgi:hypothetical protein